MSNNEWTVNRAVSLEQATRSGYGNPPISPSPLSDCSQFDNIPWLQELEPQALMMNTVDAEARGIVDRDSVRVYNDRGEVIVQARVTERIMPGVADLPEGAWYSPDERGVDHGGNPNVLTLDRRSPGGAFCSNSCLVQVEKA